MTFQMELDRQYELGREEGISLGELNNKLATAKNLIKENFPPEFIKKITGLSFDQIMSCMKNT